MPRWARQSWTQRARDRAAVVCGGRAVGGAGLGGSGLGRAEGVADLRRGRTSLETAQTAARPPHDVAQAALPELSTHPKSVDPDSRCSCSRCSLCGNRLRIVARAAPWTEVPGRSATHAGAGAREQRRARGATARPRRVVSGAAPERRPAGAPTPLPGFRRTRARIRPMRRARRRGVG